MRRGWPERLRCAWAGRVARRRDRSRASGGVALADAARRSSDWATAISLYAEYLRRHPRDFGIRLRLLRTLYSAARLDEAESLLSEMRKARPDRTELASLAADIEAARSAFVALKDYDEFRRGYVVPSAPALDGRGVVQALVNASGKSVSDISLTLRSLRASRIALVSIFVIDAGSGVSMLPHEMAETTLLADDQIDASIFEVGARILLLDAGSTLETEAVGWLGHALDATGALAVYGDDDRMTFASRGEAAFSEPAFHSAPHPLELATTPRFPVAVMFDHALLADLKRVDRRAVLTAAFMRGQVAHVPYLLATAHEPWAGLMAQPAQHIPPSDRILVIIPTRDEADALSVMVDSLFETAGQPSLLDLVVVDNGSIEGRTLSLLDALSRAGRICVRRVDEPFNWSRLNNIAAGEAGTLADILLFANNDMRMLTDGWDDRLRAHLATPEVAVVGARLVYPTGLLQHGGVVLGAWNGHLVHDGLGAAPFEVGPLERWRRSRPAAAVTGAFMGVRRWTFEQAGGFDESFAIGCNDIDFCLRVREQGGAVLYAADLELVHAESLSRGHDDTEARMRRADAERAELFRIWGADAARDPGRNPHWANHETLLWHGLVMPEPELVDQWVRRSTDRWRVIRH